MTNRDLEVLGDLGAACRNYTSVGLTEWVKPMDCGGSNGSDHSYRLSKLVRLGLAKRKRRGGWIRGSWEYWITDDGLAAIAKAEGAE